MATIDTDRLWLSRQLTARAADFRNEAAQPMWIKTRIAGEFAATATGLDDMAIRATIGDDDIAVLTAWLDAAYITHRRVLGARKFFETLGEGGPL